MQIGLVFKNKSKVKILIVAQKTPILIFYVYGFLKK